MGEDADDGSCFECCDALGGGRAGFRAMGVALGYQLMVAMMALTFGDASVDIGTLRRIDGDVVIMVRREAARE